MKAVFMNDFYMFLLIIITVAGSCFLIHFAYAMYQNFMMGEGGRPFSVLSYIAFIYIGGI